VLNSGNPSRPAAPGKPAEQSKHEIAYHRIRERILDGRYGPGHRLVLSSLARDLDVSPVPVREAIRRLEAEGLVTFERNVGARVGRLDEEAWEQFVQMLALLDGYAFACAHGRIPDAAIAEAQELNDRLRGGLDGTVGPEQVMGVHRRFHRTIYQHSGNDYLIESLDRVWDRIDASRVLATLYPAKRLISSVDEHDQLLARLRLNDGDPAVLERCARQHNLNTIIAIRGNGRVKALH
jgi:DNA-binding GntR family transcriptional regulator